MPKQLINLLGIVVVAAVVVGGFLLFAAPALAQASSIGAQTQQVAQTNQTYQAQVSALRAKKAQFDAIKADVSALRKQIPAVDQRDDVFELVAHAATAAGVSVVRVTASDSQSWTVRAGADQADPSAPSGSASPSPAPQSTPAPSPAPTAGAGAGGTTAPTPTPAGPAQTQVPFVIVIAAPTPAAAAAFIDRLGDGPRLLSIIHSQLLNQDTGPQLTVNALAFVRSEK